MSTTTPNLNLIQPSKSEKGGWTTYTTNNRTIDAAYGEYLDDREQSLENIAPIEGNTASTNYAVGKYLVKDGGLYKVTAAIASGESIVVGTNVVATSLNDAVVELNTAVATLQDSLSALMQLRVFEVSTSIGTDTGKQGSTNISSITGYVPVGIVGAKNTAWELAFTIMHLDRELNQVVWAVSNPSREARNFTMYFTVLYVKNG